MTPIQRKRAFLFILMTLTLDAMGIGLILPVMPDLIAEVNGGTIGTAAIWGGILATTFAVMQFIFGPVLGSLSDRFGRRPILLISLFVMTLDYLIMAVAGTIWLLFVTRVIGGITAATQSAAHAFIADISEPEEKSANFGLLGAAFGLGFVLGPVIGGLLGELGTRAPFYAAAALGAINLCFGYFVLPETVTDRIRRPFSMRRANPFGAFKALSQLDGLRRLILLVFLYEFAFIAYPATWAYFTKEAFGWSPGMVGVSLALFGVGMAFVQAVLIRVALKHWGERITIIYGIAFNFLAFIALTLITNGWVALVFIPLTSLGAVVNPAVQGLMSKRAGDDQQGELQGVISSARSMAMIFSPLVMTQLFWAFTNETGAYFPGAAFALSAAIMIACLIVFLGRKRTVVQ
ncbi:TCR/Tet family MFS transporter [Octadecabacter sp. 1_MG-2023]|uniref:TCR/Tet family MFS transporter n=1 Tax=unclassified Octadecabacter TaxID=196158 RepID=UPI001C0930A5|nr:MULTISPECIES: TCR/Tet family MFS transporter [unclassified Octadecabacter]MBU2994524.1 TCR/Tet family MFS transporter [Octadecabacter sp. B2R22]MDO6734183.1 TCR/Tet family MFS transporter [Octadecabacter sp. 1_MG-2023]